MSENDIIQKVTESEYEHGFETVLEQEYFPKGLNEQIIRGISERKGEPEWLLEFRLKAYNKWLTMKMPQWPQLKIPEIDYQDIIYFSAPKKVVEGGEIDPELEATFEKLGIPLNERKILSGVAAMWLNAKPACC